MTDRTDNPTSEAADTAFPPVPANIQRMWARFAREPDWGSIMRAIDQAEDGSEREKARAAVYLDDGTYSHEIENMSAEDAALWLIDRADQDLSCDDHCREQVGPLQPRDFGY